jgi:tetratricopeptide (TPR) repeat protein
MKKIIIWGMIVLGALSLALMGFQCSSAELTSAKLYIQRKEYQNAEAQLTKELNKNPKNEEAWFLLGQVRIELQDYRGMKEAFAKALEIAPTHRLEISGQEAGVWGRVFNYGVEKINSVTDSTGAVDSSKFGEAIEAFKLAIYIMPDSAMNNENLGFAYYRRGDIDSAITPLTIAMEKKNSLFAIRVLSSIYLSRAAEFKSKFTEQNRADIEEARNIELLKEKMKAVDVKIYIGQPSSVKQEKTGKGKKAVVSKEMWAYDKLNLVVTVEDGIVTNINFSKPYVPRIDSTNHKLSLAEYSKAIYVLKKGVQLAPSDAELSESLMNSYIGADLTEEARALLNDRVQKYPDSKYDRYNLGVFLLKDNKFEEAISEFKSVLEIDPAFSSATYNLAATFVNWGVAIQDSLKKVGNEENKSYKDKFKEAIPYLLKVTSEQPENLQILDLLVQVYANTGETEKAKEFYDKSEAIRKSKN